MKYLLLLLIGLANLQLNFGQNNVNRNLFSNKDARFIKAQQVTTFTDYVFSTKTIYPQCVSSVVTGSPCTGKRRRRKKRMAVETGDQLLNQRSDGLSVEGSLAKDERKGDTGESNREPKFGFTIWTTTRTTSTATIKYTNTATTLSLIYLCTAGNVEFPSPYSCISG